MGDIKVKLDRAGVRALLKSAAVSGVCRDAAEGVRGRAGAGFEVGQRNYPERTGYAVYPGDAEAYFKNLRNNTLLKAVGK